MLTEISKSMHEENTVRPADKQMEAAKQVLTRTAGMMTRRRTEMEEAEKLMEQPRAELQEVFKE